MKKPPDTNLAASIYIACTPSQLWNALTTASKHVHWNSAPCLSFGSNPPETVSWGDDTRVFYEGHIIVSDEAAGKLAHTFQFVGFGFEEPETTVAIRLHHQGPIVRLELNHNCTDAPRTAEIISQNGWLKALCRLKTYLETEVPMPWPEE